MSLRITKIQRFCLNDGPGIRTTVFFKGCNLHCPWCANPENLSYDIQTYYNENTGEPTGVYGYDISDDDLFDEIIKDKPYMIDGGGVTFSGGEVMLQADKLSHLCRKLKKNDINIAVETALMIKRNFIEYIIPYVDLFYIDIKILEKHQCKEIIGGNVDLFIDNVKYIEENNKEIIFRIPCCDSLTFYKNNLELIKDFLVRHNHKIEIFQIHNLGNRKYRSLGMEPIVETSELSKDISEYVEGLKNYGMDIEIIKL